jgi:hypothetical protein
MPRNKEGQARRRTDHSHDRSEASGYNLAPPAPYAPFSLLESCHNSSPISSFVNPRAFNCLSVSLKGSFANFLAVHTLTPNRFMMIT